MSGLPVSVLIATRNEAENLPDCLRSLDGFDDVVVVDSDSADATPEIARQHGATLVPFVYDGHWPKKRNWALEHHRFRHPWILVLDADERMSPTLMAELQTVLCEPGDTVAFYVRWRFVFLGRWMKHAWSHGWMLRLFKLGHARYEDLGMRAEGGWDAEVHENLVSTGPTARLEALLEHAANTSLSHWLDKQNAFSDWNAARRETQLADPCPPVSALFARDPLRRRKAIKARFIRLPCTPLLTFLYLYLIRGGFLDGRAGFYFCALRAQHELNTRAKMFERRHVAGRE